MRYNRLYLDDLAEAQGVLFEEVVNKGYDLIDFVNKYMCTRIKKLMDEGSPKHCTMYHYDIFDELEKCDFKYKKAMMRYDPWAANWIGEFYARLQWETGVYSSFVLKCVPITTILTHYNVLHDLDMSLAVNRYVPYVSKGEGFDV